MEEETAMEEKLTLVARKACFNLPTACPASLPVYLYLKFSKIPFHLAYNLTFPDSDQIPYVDCDTYVAYNNERGGVIESLKEDGIVNLDKEVQNLPEWVSAIAMINSWLSDALLYELWIGSDGSRAQEIYYSDLPWPIGKILYLKQVHNVKHLLSISNENAKRRGNEIYRRATIAYQALSTMLGDESFFFDNRPTSLDAMFLGHALIVLKAFAKEGSVLQNKLLEHRNLVTYAEKHQAELLDAGSSSSDPSSSSSSSSSSASIPRRGPSNPSSKPKSQPKKERTEEEKSFRKKAKYFLVTQMVAVLVFISIFNGSDDAEVDADGDEGFDYDN